MHVNTRNLNYNPKIKKGYQEIILEEKIKNYSKMNSFKNINFYDTLRVFSHAEEIVHRDLHSKNILGLPTHITSLIQWSSRERFYV
ncbi:hypothetical protein RCL_jg4980.t1 [Rhizophagus clarus]|uniref:Uncharacterized protein n=1 Tax=Rhizophagus clarus TaxID=94130 RepID=A0A8H3QMT1_9GLOM|nr:hypothetical protein RCL_jg4980.t1 [Rhizophagus clarus]